MIKVVVTGAGQLAWELQRTAPQNIEFIGLARAELDITNADQVNKCIEETQPTAVINAAAYTAVDKAESDKQQAFAVNCDGPAHLAKACKSINAYFLHVSTDFVFNGLSTQPYSPDDEKHPLGVYGESKAAGEESVANIMGNDWAVIRTAWVYSSYGNNFVKTMLRLMSEKPELGVVGDQIGTPTWAKGLAEVCWQAVEKKIEGLYHWSDAGVASWYDFAVAIQRLGIEQGLLSSPIPIKSIATQDYPTPAARPAYSVLNKNKALQVLPEIGIVHWQDQLKNMMRELSN